MSVHGPILSLVEYISIGEKPRLITGFSVTLPPVATALTAPKSSNPAEYHKATAVEALFGYLALIGDNERIEELFAVITDIER